MKAPALDPITLEILHNGLRSVTDEMWTALRRSAYSTNIKERHDHSTAIIDIQGRLIAQSELSFPTHLGAIIGAMETLLKKYSLGECEEGDVFICNDPHVAGGTHLPDVNIMMPVHVDGEILAFVCTIAHHADIGGMSPGSMDACMTEIFQEGLRIPVIKLFHKGKIDKDLLELILLNVRVPEERQGDYFAQIAACNLGHRRLAELKEQYTASVIRAAFDDIIERTHARMRGAIQAIPDGIYTFEDLMDDDGVGTYDIRIKVRVIVNGDDIHVDFTGTDPQVKGNINAPYNSTHASVSYVLKALLDPDIPNNHGVRSAIKVTMPPGTIGNAVFPGAVASRNHFAQRLVDVVLGALAPALPEAVTAASNGANTSVALLGTDPQTGKSYVYFETIGGGFGGRYAKDGKDAVQVHITNTSNSPVEAFEMEYPVRIEEYSLVEDSGGAGRYRGGLGIRRVIRPIGHVATFNAVGERFRHPPWGLDEGQPGRCGQFTVLGDDGTETKLPGKAATQPLRPDQRLIVESPGAGGYGPPEQRTDEAVMEDYTSGKYSTAYLAQHYPGRTF
jgi:N-methylhydantoinase B